MEINNDLNKMSKWTLLLVGKNNGLVGIYGDKFLGHPSHYFRVDVIDLRDYELLYMENQELRNEVHRLSQLLREKEIS